MSRVKEQKSPSAHCGVAHGDNGVGWVAPARLGSPVKQAHALQFGS